MDTALIMPPLPTPTTLDQLPQCEIPNEEGNSCSRPAKRVLRIYTGNWSLPVAACDQCADYLEREARKYAARDR